MSLDFSGNGGRVTLTPEIACAAEGCWKTKMDGEAFCAHHGLEIAKLTAQYQPKFADMSSAQRSASMDAIVARSAELTAAHNAMAKVIAGHASDISALEKSVDAQNVRIDALERTLASFACASFMARLRWFLTGR